MRYTRSGGWRAHLDSIGLAATRATYMTWTHPGREQPAAGRARAENICTAWGSDIATYERLRERERETGRKAAIYTVYSMPGRGI